MLKDQLNVPGLHQLDVSLSFSHSSEGQSGSNRQNFESRRRQCAGFPANMMLEVTTATHLHQCSVMQNVDIISAHALSHHPYQCTKSLPRLLSWFPRWLSRNIKQSRVALRKSVRARVASRAVIEESRVDVRGSCECRRMPEVLDDTRDAATETPSVLAAASAESTELGRLWPRSLRLWL